MSPLRLASLLLLLLSPPAMAQERLEMRHDGKLRTVLIDLAREAGPAPLVIALHGGLAGPQVVRRRASVTLPQRGWAVAWPAATSEWNDGRRRADGSLYNGTDDVGFLRALVAHLAGQGLVDPDKVFVAGISLGGTMALRLVCEAPDFMRGAAVTLAALPVGLRCPADGPPVPLLLLNGTADFIMPPAGGPIGGGSALVRDRGSVRPLAETAALFAQRNGCSGYQDVWLPERDSRDGTRTMVRQYTGCAAPLVHYIVHGGGHTWPGALPRTTVAGPASQDFSATATIERFFESLVD